MRIRQLLIYGFSIFSMFFGSGNLVFPLKIGFETQGHWGWGFLGLSITGILLPLLGLIVIKVNHGQAQQFFGQAGRLAQFSLPLIILSLLGSFGVLPRCIIVAFGGIKYVWPQADLILFGALFSIACYLICLKERWLMAMLGKILTPVLLLFLAILIAFSIFHAAPHPSNTLMPYDCFMNGFFQGYETMDLFAAFFFSALIFKQIEASQASSLHTSHSSNVFKYAILASLIGISLLAAVYYAFIYMGAAYSHIALASPPENILPIISFHVLGAQASVILSIIMVLSCLTTAVALNSIYARYLVTMTGLSSNKFPWVLLATTSIAFLLSNLQFNGISKLLEPVLQITYPALIALTIMSLLFKNRLRLTQIVFFGIIIFTIGYKWGMGFIN